MGDADAFHGKLVTIFFRAIFVNTGITNSQIGSVYMRNFFQWILPKLLKKFDPATAPTVLLPHTF
jgi:hypothetical protein